MSIFDTILSSLRSLFGGERTAESTSSAGTSESDTAEPSSGTVSVEREPSGERDAVDASTEAAVKGTDDADESAAASDTPDEPRAETDTTDEAVAAETDASASTETLVDEDVGKEPAEVVETADEGEESVTADPEDAETPDDAVAAETDASASTETLVDEAEGKEPAEVVTSTEAPEEEPALEPDDEVETEEADDEVETEDVDEEPEPEDVDEEDAETVTVESLKGIGPAYAGRLEDAGIETVADLAAADAEEIAEEIDVSPKRVSDWIERAQEE